MAVMNDLMMTLIDNKVISNIFSKKYSKHLICQIDREFQLKRGVKNLFKLQTICIEYSERREKNENKDSFQMIIISIFSIHSA